MKSFFSLILASTLLVAGGPAFAQEPMPMPAVSMGIASKLVVRGTLNGLLVTDLRAQRKNNLLVVQASIDNTTPADVRLYYRFSWIDNAGMQVGDGEVWKPIGFMGLQSLKLNGVAYGPQAVDFHLEMSSEPK